MATNNNNNETKENIVKLDKYVSYELLKKMKAENPDTKFILPNGKEAVLNAKKGQSKSSK